LHHKSKQPRRQTQEKQRIAQPLSEARGHRMDGNSKAIVLESSARNSVQLVKSVISTVIVYLQSLLWIADRGSDWRTMIYLNVCN
jgi:hypothetical protein